MQKQDLLITISKELAAQGLNVVRMDGERPWGGFFVIDEDQSQLFSDIYFDGVDVNTLKKGGKLSPKILVVAPNSRLSWQYHHRRSEIWKIVSGTVGIKLSDDDNEGQMEHYQNPDQITLEKGVRHRLIGLDNWGVVAEIWQHTDAEHPSDEDDIIRVQDDFGR